jgi:hypothetical protein
MSNTKRQEENLNQQEPHNTPGGDRVSSGKQYTSQSDNQGEHQDTRHMPYENLQPDRSI